MLRSFKNKLAFGIAAILSVIFISSCSTDLDPNTEYKEIMVIYGLLDAGNTVHYIKVNKAFLNTRSNALTIAATTDSTTYKDSLKVELQKLSITGRDTSVAISYPLTRTTIQNKEPGTFQYPEQVLYKTGNVTLDENGIYRVMATNLRTGVSAYAVTPIVNNFCVSQVGGTPFQCNDTAKYKKFSPQQSSVFRFAPTQNAEIYKVALDFDYLEITGADTARKTVNWVIENNLLIPYSNTLVQLQQRQKVFFDHLRTVVAPIPAGSSTYRVAGDIRVSVTAGSKTLATYYLVNNTFSAITQTRPEFDNVTNGTGLFASRRTVVVLTRLDQQALGALRTELPQHKF